MRAKYGIFVIVILLFLAGCNNNEPDHQTDASEDVVIDTGLEEENDTSVSENEPEISLVYVENYLEEEGEIIDFLKEYFMISGKEDLEVLTQLPLTESFFNSCLDDFDYLDEADEIRFVYVAAWLATEENVYECLVRTYDYEHDTYWGSDECLSAYSVKITLIGNQIDQVVIEKIGWDGENHTEESGRREYTQEDLERAWNNRLGNYGVSLTTLPEIEVCEDEEKYEIPSTNGEDNYLLTVHVIQMVGAEYESINAGLAETMEEERKHYEATGSWGDTTAALYICRLDGRVISVKNSEYLLISDNAATFDMATGEKLACADIFADKDTAEAIIAENLVTQIENNSFSSISNWDKAQYISKAESFSFEGEIAYQWYLDGESVVIVATALANHRFVVVLPYREYAYLFKPQYLPGDGVAYYRSNNTGTEHIEFNGVITEGVELMGSDSSDDYSWLYPDVVGYYINDGTKEYICISVPGMYDFEHRSYLCSFTENGIEPLAEFEGKKFFFVPEELREWIDSLP